MAKFEISNDELKDRWEKGHSVRQLTDDFRCHENTIRYRLRLMGLGNRDREAGIATSRGKRPSAAPDQVAAPTHVAAVVMPAQPLQARKDWPDLLAAVQRAKGNSAPKATLAIIATRFRLPVAVVQGLAGREWAK